MLNFEELYIAYSPDVYRFANWLCGSSSDAEDITSETFVRVWLNLGTIRTETLKAYLFTIARNIFLGSLRERQDHGLLSDRYPDAHPPIESIVEIHSELDLIRESLLAIIEIDRSAFVMRVQYDLPYAEIARVLQLSENAVKVKVHRVRKRLFDTQSKKEPI